MCYNGQARGGQIQSLARRNNESSKHAVATVKTNHLNKAQWLLHVPPGLTLKFLRSSHTVYYTVFCVELRTTTIFLYSLSLTD